MSGLPVVCVGASAGGLEALRQLFVNVPSRTGAAFVVVQHLDPAHASGLADALAKVSKLSVVRARNGQRLRAGCVYVIEAAREARFVDGTIEIVKRA